MSSVVLPQYWRVDEQDGTTPHVDEPSELIPAGVYLIGMDDDSDPESVRVTLRAQLAIDEDGSPGTTEADVVRAIAARLARAE